MQNANEALHQLVWSKCPKMCVFFKDPSYPSWLPVNTAQEDYDSYRSTKWNGGQPGRHSVTVTNRLDERKDCNLQKTGRPLNLNSMERKRNKLCFKKRK